MVNHKEVLAKGLTIWPAIFLLLAGVVATYTNVIVSLAWLAVVIISFRGFLNGRPDMIWYCIAASPVLEVWARMSKAPFLPYEIGKYYLLFAIMLLLVHSIHTRLSRSYYSSGYLIIVLISPSLIVNAVYFNFEQWVFNSLGVIELACLLILASFERWSIERFCKTMQVAIIPIVPVVVYLTLSASNFNEITFDLTSNAVTSGGFASNQVSTILGSSIVMLLLLHVLKRPLFNLRLLDFGLLLLLIFRGLLTFSRGGMIVAGIAVFIALSANIFVSVRSFVRFTVITAVVFGVSLAIFSKVNNITGNQLALRYKGESFGTVEGYYKKDLNTITSGREDIVKSDMLIFSEHPFFGVGPGISKTLRSEYGYENIAAHTEFTRLLSEHGIGGAIVVIVLISFPVWWLRRQKIVAWRGVIAALFALAILTTFHAAMRTNTSIVIYALAAIPVFYYSAKSKIETADKNIIHRK